MENTTKRKLTDGRRRNNLTAEQRSKIGRLGGKASHPQGRGLANASAETRKKVARKGGKASRGGGRRATKSMSS